MHFEYTKRERVVLWSLAIVGVAALNGVFLWALFARPELVASASHNPVSAVFIMEALLLAGLLSYLLPRWGVSRMPWPWFLAVALAGGLLFALPLAALWGRRTADRRAQEGRA
jgi:hypothetical protein